MSRIPLKFHAIEYIAISDLYLLYDDNELDCESVIIKSEGSFFKVTSEVNDYGENGFSIKVCDSYQEELWPRQIISTKEEPIRFIREEAEPNTSPVLRFEVGNRPLLITADDDCLIVGMSHWDINGEWIEYENNTLLNDYEV